LSGVVLGSVLVTWSCFVGGNLVTCQLFVGVLVGRAVVLVRGVRRVLAVFLVCWCVAGLGWVGVALVVPLGVGG